MNDKFTQMHNDYLDPDKYFTEQPELNLSATDTILKLADEYNCETVGDLYRIIYKYTACGPSMGIEIYAECDEPIQYYCDDLYKISIESLANEETYITKIFISSIVEGVDEGTQTITLADGCTPDTFWKAVEKINSEASDIWMQTHGCETCAKHFCIDLDEEMYSPVWLECPDCDGEGQII